MRRPSRAQTTRRRGGRSVAETCGFPDPWTAWIWKGPSSNCRQATRKSSFFTTWKVTNTTKSLPSADVHLGIRNRNCTRLARDCANCCSQVAGKETSGSRIRKPCWRQCRWHDGLAQESAMRIVGNKTRRNKTSEGAVVHDEEELTNEHSQESRNARNPACIPYHAARDTGGRRGSGH